MEICASRNKCMLIAYSYFNIPWKDKNEFDYRLLKSLYSGLLKLST